MSMGWRRRLARPFAHRGGSSDGVATMKHPTSMGEGDLEVAQIRAALLLPEVDRVALVLQVQCRRSPAEIASELKLTVPEVLTRLCRARQRLLLLCSDDTQRIRKNERRCTRSITLRSTHREDQAGQIVAVSDAHAALGARLFIARASAPACASGNRTARARSTSQATRSPAPRPAGSGCVPRSRA